MPSLAAPCNRQLAARLHTKHPGLAFTGRPVGRRLGPHPQCPYRGFTPGGRSGADLRCCGRCAGKRLLVQRYGSILWIAGGDQESAGAGWISGPESEAKKSPSRGGREDGPKHDRLSLAGPIRYRGVLPPVGQFTGCACQSPGCGENDRSQAGAIVLGPKTCCRGIHSIPQCREGRPCPYP